MNVQKIKSQMFNLEDPADKAFSLFEVVNTCEGPGYGDPDKLPNKGPYGEPEEY